MKTTGCVVLCQVKWLWLLFMWAAGSAALEGEVHVIPKAKSYAIFITTAKKSNNNLKMRREMGTSKGCMLK